MNIPDRLEKNKKIHEINRTKSFTHQLLIFFLFQRKKLKGKCGNPIKLT